MADREAKRAEAERKRNEKRLVAAEKKYEREKAKCFSEKHSVSFGRIYIDSR